MWSFVQSQAHQHWLWHAIDHDRGAILADVMAAHEDQAFWALKAL
jgi:insertion element IS1 protein InsB